MQFDNFPNFQAYKGKSLLAVDYGTVVTGLAFFVPGREPFPQPFGKIAYESDDQLIKELLKVIEDECVDVIILGLPLHMDGKESEMTARVRNFANSLESNLEGISLILQDETLSSYEAESRMKASPRYNFKVDPTQIDALAASIILEDFLKAE